MLNSLAEFVVDVTAAAAELNPRSRQMIGAWLAGYTQAEIASALGITQGRVSQEIKAGFCELSQKLAYT